MALYAQPTSSFRWSSHRSMIRCTPGVGLRTDPFFLIFINDLPDNIKSSVRLFVEDCVLEHSFIARLSYFAGRS